MSREPKSSYVQKQQKAERERQEATHYSYQDQIITALQGLDEKSETSNEQERAYHGQQYRLETKRYWLEVGTVIGVWIAAILTAVQATIFFVMMKDAERAAQKAHNDNVAALGRADTALDQARKNFLADQRPIIYFDNDPKIPTDLLLPFFDESRSQVDWNVYFKNFGRSTAINVQILLLIKIGDRDFTENVNSLGFGATSPLPPGDGSFGTVFSRPSLAISREEFDNLYNKSGGIIVKAIIRYTDSAGTPYETGICRSKNAN